GSRWSLSSFVVRKFVISGNDASASPSPILEITLLRRLLAFRYWRSVAEWGDRMYRFAVVGGAAPPVASESRELLRNFPRLTTLKLMPWLASAPLLVFASPVNSAHGATL